MKRRSFEERWPVAEERTGGGKKGEKEKEEREVLWIIEILFLPTESVLERVSRILLSTS